MKTMADLAAGEAELEHLPPTRARRHVRITDLFADEAGRLSRMSGEVARIRFDFSKALASVADRELLAIRARNAGFVDWRTRLFAGEMVNASEHRATAQVSERGSGASPAIVAARAAHANSINRTTSLC